nr:BspA family leucine-rich repeat surface protein [Clostridia bacterium]
YYDDTVYGYIVEVLDNGDGTLSLNQGFAEPIYSDAEPCGTCNDTGSKLEYTISYSQGRGRNLTDYQIAMGVSNDTSYVEYKGKDEALRRNLAQYLKNIVGLEEDIPEAMILNAVFFHKTIGDELYTVGYYCPECNGNGNGICLGCNGTGYIDNGTDHKVTSNPMVFGTRNAVFVEEAGYQVIVPDFDVDYQSGYGDWYSPDMHSFLKAFKNGEYTYEKDRFISTPGNFYLNGNYNIAASIKLQGMYPELAEGYRQLLQEKKGLSEEEAAELIDKYASGTFIMYFNTMGYDSYGGYYRLQYDLLYYPTCEDCGGTGKIKQITGWSTEAGELPVFVNTLKPGNLAVTKYVTNADSADPTQEFRFKIKLIGEEIEDGELHYELDQTPANVNPDSQTSDGDETDNPDTGSSQPGNMGRRDINRENIFHATEEQLQGTAYAVLTDEGELIFFRSSQSYSDCSEGTFTDIKGNTYTGTVFTGFENSTQSPSWQQDDIRPKIVHVSMADGQAVKPAATNSWFYNLWNCTGLDIKYLDTSRVTSMYRTFGNCGPKFTCLDLSTLDTGNVTSMLDLFSGSSWLKEVDLSSFDTGNVTNMEYMFNHTGIDKLDLSHFNTSKVTNMHAMFNSCGVTELNLTGFDTSNVTRMDNMFSGLGKLVELDISSFDTSNVTRMGDMFQQCNVNPKKVILGENFRFKNTSLCVYNTYDNAAGKVLYTGKWIREDGTYGPFTASELQSRYNASMAGAWIWEKIPTEYKIKFTAEDAAGAMADRSYTAAESVILPANRFYRFGYAFDHWTVTDISGAVPSGETTYADKDTIPANKYAVGSIVTLTAAFEPIDTTVNMVDGEFELILHGSETATFSDLPAGTAYQVYEETPDGWVLIEQSNVSGTIEPLETSNAAFTNKYQPGTATAQFNGTKTLDGQAAEKDSFSFMLTEPDNQTGTVVVLEGGEEKEVSLPIRVNVLEGGFVQFPIIQYSVDDIGVHTYEITEVNPNNSTIDYDRHTETVTVTVSGDITALTAAVDVDPDGDGRIAFVNKTRPGELRIAKSGYPVTDKNKDDEFTFKVTFMNDKGLPLGEDNEIDWYVIGTDGSIIIPTAENTDPAAADQGGTGGRPAYAAPRITARTGAHRVAADRLIPDEPDAMVRSALIKLPTAARSKEVFHATEDQLVGDAYAILTDEGELIFFRSTETLTAGAGKTVTINGEEITGRIFTGVENTNFNGAARSHSNTQWSACEEGSGVKVKSARVAEGHAIRPKSMAFWFAGWQGTNNRQSSLESFDPTGIDTSQCTSMAAMFARGHLLTSLDLSTFDTSNVKSMSNMFWGCGRLTSSTLDISSFDTSNVKNMSRMFCGCSGLRELDLTHFKTSSVTDMSDMFAGCTSLADLDVSSFDTSNVTTMHMMFYQCFRLRDPDLSVFDTSNVTDMGYMFQQSGVTTLDLSNFNTSKVSQMYYMFDRCTSMTSLTLPSSFVTSNVTNMSHMFNQCQSLESLNLGSFNTSKVTDMTDMFKNCNALTSITLGPDFSFQGTNISETNKKALLCTPSSTIPYTGKWIREDLTAGPFTSEQMRDGSYNNKTMFGIWVWEVDQRYGSVRFDANGGYTSASNYTSMSVPCIVIMPTSSNTTRTHYLLTGWNTERNGSGTNYLPGERTNNLLEIGKVKTLYAQWEATDLRNYEVRHYQQRVNSTQYTLVQTERLMALKGTEVTPPVRTYTGFTSPEPKTGVVKDDDSLVISYYYDRITYTVIFNGNGADSGVMDNQTITGGYSTALSPNSYQKEGAIFTGWNTEADGSGTSYSNGQRVSGFGGDSEQITLYAQWLDNPNEALTPEAGVVYVTCKVNEQIVFPNLPAGTTYTVEEVNLPYPWTQGYVSGAQGTILSNQTSTARISNYYNAEGELYLTAHKMLED